MMNKRALFSILLIFTIGMIIFFYFIFNPSLVTTHFSPDSVIGMGTIIKIYFIKSFFLILSIILFSYSLIGIINRDYVKRLNEITLEYVNKIAKKINNILIFLKFYKENDSLLLKRVILVWIIFLMISLCSGLLDAGFSWKNADGYEYLWIAESIESGHGFSLPSCARQGFKPTPPCDRYSLTAHEEPVYPYLMAFTTKIFGEYGRLIIVILQVFALFFTSIVIFHLGRKVFNSSTGILAGSILPLLPHLYTLKNTFSPVMFAGLIISVSLYLLIWCLEKVSVRRGIVLGLILGVSSLMYAPTIPFIPIAVFFVFISKSINRSVALKASITILLAAMTILSGWTVRNLIVFERFVPVRTASGMSLYQFNVIFPSTYSSNNKYDCSDTLGDIWKAKNAKDAIMASKKSLVKQKAIFRRAIECIELDVPEGYEQYNAAERDKVYLNKAWEFILNEPQTFFILTYNRIIAFFFYLFDRSKGVISFLFLVSALITLNNQKARILTMLVFAYLVPYFLVVVSWFYRYRYPIEPILLIFASYIPVLIVSKFCMLFKHSRSE